MIDGSVNGLTAEVIQRNGIDLAVEFDVKSDYFGIRIQGATARTQRDELFVVERVKTDGFRFLLHQERTDPSSPPTTTTRHRTSKSRERGRALSAALAGARAARSRRGAAPRRDFSGGETARKGDSSAWLQRHASSLPLPRRPRHRTRRWVGRDVI